MYKFGCMSSQNAQMCIYVCVSVCLLILFVSLLQENFKRKKNWLFQTDWDKLIPFLCLEK